MWHTLRGVSRRQFLAASGALLGGQALAQSGSAVAPCPAPAAVPSGRADGVRTGGARTVRIDGKYDVWVKQVGSGNVPLLTLHGGPGFNHYYLECLEDMLPPAGIRFWYYDQLGCGFSDNPDDASLWTLQRYLGEVEQVRQALGLERFLLYGHSWGGLLGMEYALRHPQHLAGLVISNMTASVAEYVKHAEVLLSQLPPAARATIQKARAARNFESPEYEKVLMEEVYSKHVCRLDPWPEPVQRTFRTFNGKIYNLMQGPDEFTITGNLRDWDAWERLPGIKVPTLVLGGQHDEMAPEQLARMAKLIPHARLVICPRGSHMAMYDDQQAYFTALLSFFAAVRSERFHG